MWGLVAAALILTLLNGVKPLHADDPTFHSYAAQIAAHPLDPYGFELISLPALHELGPPVVPYWWGLAIRLFGDRPFLWKAWLFPFCLLLVLALHALARRFAPGFETPLVWMTIVSPLVLPSVNLMLDIPALALGLTALAVFIRAIDRYTQANVALLSVTAGIVAGLAMQTKYTALVVPVLIVLYAALVRRVSWGLVAASIAVLVFVSWELLIAIGYGESHFLYHFRLRAGLSPPHRRMLQHILPLVAIVGGVAPAIAVLALGALGATRRVVVAGAVLVLLGYAALALVPNQYAVFLVDRATGKSQLTLNNLVFGALGAGVCATFVAVVRREWPDRMRGDRLEWFLLLWCGVELSAYFLLSPHPAVRRVFGLVVAATFLVGRLASRSGRDWKQAPFVRDALALSMLLGVLFYGVDLLDARSEREAVERAVMLIGHHGGGATTWYAGCCGARFYGERAGMIPIVPYRSLLRKGDWIFVPDQRLPYSKVCLPEDRTELAATIRLDDVVPLTLMPSYYIGRTPMLHLDGPRLSAELYRVGMDFVACAPG